MSKLARLPTDTGGNFSVSYAVERTDGRRAFLKALDYSAALRRRDAARVLQLMTESYNFERDLLDDCERRGMSRIVRVYGSGTLLEADFGHAVDYLIFEPADGDVRRALDAMEEFDAAWALSACHHAAVAVQQLHTAHVAHQDIKPSNLLTFGRTAAKLGDLGRSSKRGVAAPHDDYPVRGDPAYAPPELLYGQVDPEWRVRCQSCDLYLLGSLMLFLFTRTQATAEILRRLPPALRPARYGGMFDGTYDEVLPFVSNAFDEVADAFGSHLEGQRAAELVDHFRCLCHPDPDRRRASSRRGQPSYDLRRLISRLDVLRHDARGGFLKKAES
ncbi:MAG TPA: hypothetical protein VE010_01575 [Thermoanaerobaculia bacterium]|nr:hypothetical protein [Thermoanaerobaculia bacterium]